MRQISESACRNFDSLLPNEFRIDGKSDFDSVVVKEYLGDNQTVYDVGGGKEPYITLDCKRKLNLRVIGVDVDGKALGEAPEGIYDEVIVKRIEDYKGEGDADLVVCRTLLEHVRDVEKALVGIYGILRPGGLALVFLPCGNAIFARLNRLLPEKLKSRVLFWLYPKASSTQGYPAYYDRCSPLEIRSLAENIGFRIEFEKVYFGSWYFTFAFPLHMVWRMYQLVARSLYGKQAAETFGLVIRRVRE